MRYFFHIGYVGTQYSGWQKLPGIHSIQQTIEDALLAVLKFPIPVVGCGRTDAKVHASQFFFHLDADVALDKDVVFKINKRLPNDIAIYDLFPMEGLPHARFDAFLRHYDYYFHTCKNPFFDALSSLYLVDKLNIEAMGAAAELLPRYDDYMGLCKSPAKNEHTICRVSDVGLYVNPQNNQFRFHIESNRFLSGMIRIIMAKLIEIGKGDLSVDAFEQILIDKKPSGNLKPAHPQGLCLSKVTYRYLDIPPVGFPGALHEQVQWIKI